MGCIQLSDELCPVIRAWIRRHTHKNMCLLLIRKPVVKFRDVATSNLLTKCFEGSRPLWNRHSENRFTLFADFCPFSNMPNPVEIDICPREHRNESFARPFSLSIFFETSNRQGTSGLIDTPHIVKDILHRRTDFISGNSDHLITGLSQNIKGVLSDLLDRDTISK